MAYVVRLLNIFIFVYMLVYIIVLIINAVTDVYFVVVLGKNIPQASPFLQLNLLH